MYGEIIFLRAVVGNIPVYAEQVNIMSATFKFDADLAMQQYRKRKADNQGKEINNSSLPAGSPMYYYCKYCGAHTETLPECHMRAPKVVCDPCAPLRLHGLV